jgi:hypothetical protein
LFHIEITKNIKNKIFEQSSLSIDSVQADDIDFIFNIEDDDNDDIDEKDEENEENEEECEEEMIVNELYEKEFTNS